MAVTYVSTPHENGCRWSIGSLGGVWDDSNYMMCLISTYGGWPSGSSGQPPGSLDYQWPPTNGSNYNTPSQDFYEGLEAGRSYTLYGYAQAANGLWYPCGSASITTLAPTLSTPSPAEVNTYYNSITLQLYEVSGASTYYLDVYNSSNTCIRNLTSSNGYFNVTNLENSSQYAFYFKCSGSGYTDSGYGSYYPVNTQDGIELATPTLSLSSRTGTSIFLDVSYVGNAFRYDIEVYSSSYNYLATYSPIPPASGVLTTELYGLTPGTAYYFKVRARADTLTPYKSSPNSGYYGAWSTLVKLTTPTVRAQSQTATTITIQLNIDSRAQTCYCNLHRLSDDAELRDGISINGYFEFTGLTPNAAYYIWCSVTASGYGQSDSARYGNYTTGPIPQPSTFNWTYAKTQGNDFYLHHSEWNSLIETVQQWYAYKGYSSYTPTMYTRSAGQDFRAVDDYNRVKNAIGWFFNNSNPESGSGRANKVPEDDISAEDLNWLVYKVNSIT